MSDTSIFEISDVNVDIKEYVKVRCKSALNDNVIFKFLVFESNSPVDLSQYKVEMRARLPKSGEIYSETDNIVISGNELTVNCDGVLTSEIGEVVITLRLVDITTYKQKSNYIIILKVMSTIDSDEEVQTESTLSALSSLDYAIDRYFELKVDLLDAIDTGETLLTNLTTQNTNATSNASNLTNLNTNAVSYINSLTSLNQNATNNINNLTTQNNTASTNISNLTTQNTNATNNISTLSTLNSNANTLYNNLNSSIDSANQAILGLTNANWETIESIFNLVNVLAGGTNVVDENSNIIVDENGNEWVM